MTKSELRKIYTSQRKELSSEQVGEISLQILKNLITMDIWENSVFHVFVPITKNHEINTFLLIDYLFTQQKTVVVPKVQGLEMLSCKIAPDVNWITGKFGVSEPVEYEIIDPERIKVVFVPMLICDKKGNRVGYGGGYYDRFLKKLSPEVLKIGLNFFSPISEIKEVEIFDIALDYCVTGEEIVSFEAF